VLERITAAIITLKIKTSECMTGGRRYFSSAYWIKCKFFPLHDVFNLQKVLTKLRKFCCKRHNYLQKHCLEF